MAKKPAKLLKGGPSSATPVKSNDKRRQDALQKRNKAATHSGHIDDLQPVAGEKLKAN